jgi:acyl-CoA dehydrogenase family member 9
VADSRGFMEKIFQGYFDEAEFAALPAYPESERVRALLDDYQRILEGYSLQEIEAAGRVPDELIRKMRGKGFFGISLPVEYGGLGFQTWEYLNVIEGAALSDLSIAIIYVAHLSIGVKGIELYGNEAQKEKYLRKAASGELIFSYALTEPKIGSDAQHIETAAVLSQDGTHYILNGQKTYITNANYAGAMVTFAQMDPARPGFMGAFIVETGWPGVTIGKDMPKMGLKASSTATIGFKDVRVPVENLLGQPGDGFKIAMGVLNYGRLGLGAASAGTLDLSFRNMLQRGRSRIQFGMPIESFPLIQEKIVQTRMHYFVASAMKNFALGLLTSDPRRNVSIETSHCKLYGTTRAWDGIYNAMQVAGGAGYLATQPYEKGMRDARVTTIFEGTTEIHSIYPALLGLRALGKEIGAKRGAARMVLVAQKLLSAYLGPGLKFYPEFPAEAAREAAVLGRAIRRLLIAGVLHYGKGVMLQEFYLRRLTTLSLHLFGIIALVKYLRIGAGSRGNRILDYFLEEAKAARKGNNRLRDSRLEKITAQVMKDLSP